MRPNKFSQSAAFIAVKFYGLTRKPAFRDLFDRETIHFYERVVRSLPFPLQYYHYWLKFRRVRSLYIKFEELLLPGDLMHILARKWYVGQMLEELVSSGYEQVVVLGAGFDHLGFQHVRRGLPALEIDTPYMAQQKRKFLEHNYPAETYPEITPLNIPDRPLIQLLQQQQTLSPDKKTIIIAEGFFDYLEKKNVENILSAIRRYFTGPALVSTHFALDELKPFHRWVFRSSLRLAGEKLELGATIKEYGNLLHSCGFHPRKVYRPQDISGDLLSSINTDLPLLNGFYLLSAGETG